MNVLLRLLSLMSVLGLAACADTQAKTYTDQQICYLTRVYVDGRQYGYQEWEGEGQFGTYANWNGLMMVISYATQDRPYLVDENNPNSCTKRYPEIDAPLKTFYPKLTAIMPPPRFYNEWLGYTGRAKSTLGQSSQQMNPEALIVLGAAIAGAASPPSPPPQVAPVLTVGISDLCPSLYLNRVKLSEEISGIYKICRY